MHGEDGTVEIKSKRKLRARLHERVDGAAESRSFGVIAVVRVPRNIALLASWAAELDMMHDVVGIRFTSLLFFKIGVQCSKAPRADGMPVAVSHHGNSFIAQWGVRHRGR